MSSRSSGVKRNDTSVCSSSDSVLSTIGSGSEGAQRPPPTHDADRERVPVDQQRVDLQRPEQRAPLAKKRSVGCSSPTHIGDVVAEPPAGSLSEAASSAPPTRNGSLPATTAAPPSRSHDPGAFEVAPGCRYVIREIEPRQERLRRRRRSARLGGGLGGAGERDSGEDGDGNTRDDGR